MANNTSNRPAFTAYTVTERTGAKNIWTTIGAAWPNKDGKGFTIKLHALSLNGQIVLRESRVEDAPPEQSYPADDDIPF